VGRRDHALFLLLAATGIRLGSAIALDVEDVDLDLGAGVVHVRHLKGGGDQEVYISASLGEVLKKHVENRKSGPLFLSQNGTRISARQVQRRLGEWTVRAGIKDSYSPHALRHGFALGLYEKTADLPLCQAALGHASITSTTVYARASQDRVRAAVGSM
jgi:site-specific recombinase XerC